MECTILVRGRDIGAVMGFMMGIVMWEHGNTGQVSGIIRVWRSRHILDGGIKVLILKIIFFSLPVRKIRPGAHDLSIMANWSMRGMTEVGIRSSIKF